METDKVRRYAELRTRIKALQDEADTLKAEADEMEQALLDDLATDGVKSLQVDGRTVYIHRQLWAQREEGITAEQVCGAFKEAGLDQFVNITYNSQTVSAWLRDLERSDAPIPAELDGLLTTTEKFSLRVRKA